MVAPSLGEAVGLGLRALVRQAWLVAPGLVLAGARRAVTLPAWALLWVLGTGAALAALREHPLDPGAAGEAAFTALTDPRNIALFLGLWTAAALLGGALRVAWIAGALPTLGAEMAGDPPASRFAPGFVFGFPRVLATAALGLVLDISGSLFSWSLLLAALWMSLHVTASGGSALLAAAAAGVLTLAIAVPIALSSVADAALARAALRSEGAPEAFARSTLRFLARPGTFLLAALAFGLAGAFLPATLQSIGGIATGFARGVSPVVLLGPDLMLAVLALVLSAAFDLWWLGTVSVLACGGGPDGPAWPPSATGG